VALLFTKKPRTLISARAQVSDLIRGCGLLRPVYIGHFDAERAVLGEVIRSILDGTVNHVRFAEANAIKLAVHSIVRFNKSVRTTYVIVSQCLGNSHRL